MIGYALAHFPMTSGFPYMWKLYHQVHQFHIELSPSLYLYRARENPDKREVAPYLHDAVRVVRLRRAAHAAYVPDHVARVRHCTTQHLQTNITVIITITTITVITTVTIYNIYIIIFNSDILAYLVGLFL